MVTINKERRKALKNLLRKKKDIMYIHTLKGAFELLADSKNAETAAYGRCGSMICYYKLREARGVAK